MILLNLFVSQLRNALETLIGPYVLSPPKFPFTVSGVYKYLRAQEGKNQQYKYITLDMFHVRRNCLC